MPEYQFRWDVIGQNIDSYPVDPKYRYDSATQFSHVALEQRTSTSASFHIGLRGTTTRSGVYDHGRDLGYNLVTIDEYFTRGPDAVLAQVTEKVGSRPVYLSWDMDAFDPSCAPGVCTPAWGGYTAREGLALLRSFARFNIVAADVNTVSPPHDVNGMTAFLAAALTYEILLMIEGRSAPHDNTGEP